MQSKCGVMVSHLKILGSVEFELTQPCDLTPHMPLAQHGRNVTV